MAMMMILVKKKKKKKNCKKKQNKIKNYTTKKNIINEAAFHARERRLNTKHKKFMKCPSSGRYGRRCCLSTDFYRAMLCIRGTSHGPVSVRLSVRHKSVFY